MKKCLVYHKLISFVILTMHIFISNVFNDLHVSHKNSTVRKKYISVLVGIFPVIKNINIYNLRLSVLKRV